MKEYASKAEIACYEVPLNTAGSTFCLLVHIDAIDVVHRPRRFHTRGAHFWVSCCQVEAAYKQDNNRSPQKLNAPGGAVVTGKAQVRTAHVFRNMLLEPLSNTLCYREHDLTK